MQAVDLAIEDSSERVMDIIVRLLRFLTDAAAVTADQFEKVRSVHLLSNDKTLVKSVEQLFSAWFSYTTFQPI